MNDLLHYKPPAKRVWNWQRALAWGLMLGGSALIWFAIGRASILIFGG